MKSSKSTVENTEVLFQEFLISEFSMLSSARTFRDKTAEIIEKASYMRLLLQDPVLP